MSMFDRIIRRNRIKSERRARSKQTKKQPSKFQIEALESRLLLSGDLVNADVVPDSGTNSDSSALVLYVEDQTLAADTQNTATDQENGSTDVTNDAETSTATSSTVVLETQQQIIDVAFNSANGEILLANNSDITRIDPDSGAVLATFDIPGSDFTSSLGLQILPTAIPSLGGTAVAAGSLLVTNGTASADKIFALDPVSGDQLAVLDIGQDIDLVAGAFHSERGTLFLLDAIHDRLIELNPADGGIVNSFATPFGIGSGGLAINPATGNIWIGSNESNDLAIITPTGSLQSLIDVAPMGIDSEVSGLAFKNALDLLVSSTQGDVFQIHDPTVSIPNVTGSPGTTITVPVNVGTAGATPPDDARGLVSVDLVLAYETALLDVTDDVSGESPAVRLGSISTGGTLVTNVDDLRGTITISLAFTAPRGPVVGDLLQIDFSILAGAPNRDTILDLRTVSLNEGGLSATLVDGKITIAARDADNDGVADDVESGDSNKDGTPDSQQANVATLISFTGNQPVTFVAPSGTSFKDLTAIAPPAGAPATASIPLGFFDWTLEGVTQGTATIQVLLPATTNLTTYWKFGAEPGNTTPHFYEFLFNGTTGARFEDDVDIDPGAGITLADRITLTFVDGGRGDSDLLANGSIDDPGGPGEQANQAPVVNAATFNVPENRANGVTVGTVVANDPDAGTVLTFSIIGGNTNNAFAINANTGVITVDNSSALNFEITASFALIVQALDNGTPALSGSNTITINLTDVNERPVANNDSATTDEDAPVTVTVLANDSDPENGTLGVSSVTQAANGTVVINPDGTVTYTPDPDFFGQDSFTYRLNDGTVVDPFVIDQFTIERNGTTFFNDSFDDGIPPSNAAGSVYSVTGTMGPEAGGKLTLDLDSGALTANITETGFLLTLRARRLSNIDPTNLDAGIKSDDTFLVTGLFDLVLPSELSSQYGIRLTDVSAGAEGNDIVDLVVTQRNDGIVAIQLRDLDDIAGTNTLIEQALLESGHEQILLRLERANLANNAIQASFAYVDGGVVGAFTTFASTVQIFNGENFTRAEFRARSTPSIGTVNVTVDAVNDTPVNSVPGPQAVSEDTPLVFSTANGNAISFSDVDAGTDAVQVTLSATNGTLTLASLAGLTFTTGDGSADATLTFSGALSAINTALDGLSYVPAEDFNGLAQLTITSNDQGNSGSGGLLSDTDVVTITVNAVNDAPVAFEDNYSTNEDTPLNVAAPGVLGNDTDVEDDALTTVLVSGVTNGTLALNADGSFSYTPNANFFGQDSFTYRANDGTENSNIATVTITVNAVNDAPAAVDDNYSANEDIQLVIAAPGVLANDTDAENNALSRVLVTGVTNGNLALNVDGSFTYIPNPNFNGVDSFTYQASDGEALSNVATVTLTVNAVNDAPIAVNDDYSTNEDTPLNVVAPGLLSNDSDVDGDSLTAALVSNVANGTLALNTDGSFTYTPAVNFNGTDSFTYKANDGTDDSNVATVNITVNAVNDAPVAVNDSFNTNEDTVLNVAAPGVLGNDTDIDSATLTAALLTNPQHGTLTLNADGSFTYTPAANFNGQDSFTYKANDGSDDSNVATVNITVNAVNDAPVAVDDIFNTNEDTQLVVAAAGVLGNDTDVENSALTAVLVSSVTNGTLTLNADGSFTYTPEQNFNGSDSFTYKANDGQADSNTATVNITVNAVNDAPVAVDDNFTTDEDNQLVVAAPGVLGNDTDVENSTLIAVLVTNVTNGALVLNADGSFTYTPNGNFNGIDSFTYKSNDALADSNIATVNITVNAVNDAPVAVDDDYSTNEDTQFVVAAPGVLGNDADVENDSLAAILVSDAQHGTLILSADGSFTYAPAANFNGADSFTYKANDGQADSNIATVNITVNAVNDAPVAVDDSFSTNEDTILNVSAPGILGNDTDVEGDGLTAVLVTDVANGTLVLNSDGSFTYTPAGNFNGSDSFTYKANDGQADSAISTVTITVNAVNDAPVAVNDNYSTDEDTSLTVNAPGVLGNDTDVDSVTLTAILVTGPQHGTLTLNTNGSFTYTPEQNFNGSDSFTYKANDGQVDSNTATVNIAVNAVNDTLVAVNDNYSTNEDTPLNVAAPGVLENDTDVEGDTLSAVLVSDVQHGSLTLNSDGSFTYTPAANFNGLDSFTYKANDGQADSNTATVNITVNAVNDVPVGVNDNYSTDEDTSLTVNAPGVLGNDTDVENNALTAVLVADVTNGTLVLNADGSFTYTPAANFNGQDSFTYKANDGLADSNVATVNITVNAVNDAPVAVDDNFNTNEDTQLVVAAPGALGNDTDVENSALTAVLVSGVTNGTLVLNANGSFTYSPNPNFNGVDSFTYRANDGSENSNIATVTITVNAVNDAPVAVNDSYSTDEDTSLTVNAPGVLGNDTDVDSVTLTAVLVTGPQHGTLTLNTNGSFTYTPAANFNGNDSFAYKANDGTDDSNIATVTITVNAVNDAPVAVNDNYSTDEDSSLTVNAPGVLGNDTDVENSALTAVLVSNVTNGTLVLNSDGSFTYTPAANFFGPDSFTYKANDGTDDSNVATVNITVNAVNDAPVAVDDSFSTDEDTDLVVAAPGVLGNDTDVDSAKLTTVLVTGPQHGLLELDNLNGSFIYRPSLNFNGTDSFTYKASDGQADSNIVTVNITVNVVNDAPVAVDDNFNTNEDTQLVVAAPGVLGNDTDVENSALTAVLVSGVTNGTLILNADGSFAYTPNANFNGSDNFTYRANDGIDESNVATVNITVNAVNDAPVAVNDDYNTNEDTQLVVAAPGVLGNDTDVENSALTAVLVSSVTNGALTLNADGSFAYTPNANFFGPDSFTYKANDGTDDSNVATVNITVNAVNDAPVAVDDSFSTDEDTDLVVAAPGVLGNDTDVDNVTLTAVLVTGPQNGTLTLNTNGSFTYTPAANFNGTDSFTYKANDGQTDSNIATVNITINAVNDTLVAVNDNYSTNEDTQLVVAAPGVLGNDTDVEGDTLNAVLVAGPQHGTLALNSDGSFAYTPAANFNGLDSFTYKANDGQADSNTATVNITVNAVNDAPVAVDDSFSTNEDTILNVAAPGVVGNDTDVDNVTLTAVLVTGPQHGTLTLNTNGSFAYTPAANFNGNDSFTYKANDGQADSNVATVAITVNAVNDAPVAINDSFSTDEDTELEVAAPGVLGNDTDVDSAKLTTVLVTGPQHGLLELDNLNGSFIYRPSLNFNGTDSFTYKANDGTDDSNTATVTITVNAVNDAPVAVNDNYSTDEDASLTVNAPGVLGNDTDVDSVTLTAVLVTGPQHGTLTLSTNGLFTYTPELNFDGSDSFTYKANDGQADSNIATVNITVNAINDAPVAVNDDYNTNENTVLNVAAPGVLGNDTDVENNALTAVLVSGVTNGTLVLNADGSFTYTPDADFIGSDSFTYKANDGTDDSNVATVQIAVNAAQAAPVAQDDSYDTDEDTALTVGAPGVLGNDSNALTALLVSDVEHGTLTLNSDGSFTYTPNTNFFGPDGFTYKAADGSNDSNIATVTITVNSVNDAPVAVNDNYSVNEDTALIINVLDGVLGNDSDVENDPLEAFLVSNVTHGALTLNSNGSFTYTPDANFFGTDSFTYEANDGTDDSNVATVNITVNAVNDPPVANDDVATTTENTQVVIDVLANDSDVDGTLDPASITIENTASNGTLSIDPSTGKITYTAAVGFSGTDSFTYTVKDDQGAVSNLATVRIDVVAASHDAPQVNLITDPCDPEKTALQVIGTDGDDKIRFVPQGNNGEIKVLINGESQGVFSPTGRIIAYGLGGNDDIEVAGNIGLAAILNGGEGNDRLKGGAGASVLSGGDGNDLLIGGSGQSVLIGDRGLDRLVGNPGDDILIGGTTLYGSDHAALCEILEEWSRNDLSYSERVRRLSSGAFALTSATVIDDGAFDLLTGAAGNDWFFAEAIDKVTDRKNFEIVS